MSEKERIREALKFVEDIFTSAISLEEEKWSMLISLADEYAKASKKIKDKYPYHVNPIEELHANENANSRILCAMLRYQVDGEYKILKSFIDHFLPPDAGIREKIKNPTIQPEQYRIDLSVREKGEYALIFENKIHDAVLQKNQLARYIEALHNSEGFEYEQVYVIFLPSSSSYDTNDCCWHIPEDCCKSCNGECKLKDKDTLRKEFEEVGRYIKVTFKEDILTWLKNNVLPNILYKETLLQAAVIIYIDYLEGLFNLRTIEKDMIMELEQIIIKKLELDKEKSVIEKVKILDDKLQNIDKLKTVMDSYRQRIISETFSAQIEKIGENISNDMSEFGLIHELNIEKEDRYFSLGFKKQDWELYVIIECYKDERSFMYIGLHNEESPKNQYESDTILFHEKTYLSNHPYGWEWTKYVNDFNQLWCDTCMDDGKKIKDFIKEKLSEILKEIDEKNIKMSPNA